MTFHTAFGFNKNRIKRAPAKNSKKYREVR